MKLLRKILKAEQLDSFPRFVDDRVEIAQQPLSVHMDGLKRDGVGCDVLSPLRRSKICVDVVSVVNADGENQFDIGLRDIVESIRNLVF